MNRLCVAGASLVAGAVLLSGCEFNGAYDLPLPGSPVDADHAFEVTADFHDILNVVPKSPVMVDDVTVGEVTKVERVGWHAEVTLRIRDDVELPDNAIAEIRQVSLLGEKYVAVEADPNTPGTGRLADGDNIPLARTGRNPEVEEVLGALSALLSGGGVAQLGTITDELNKVMSGRTDRLRSLLSSLDGVVGTLDDQKGDIIAAMASLNQLTQTLNQEKSTITGALDVAEPAVKVLGDQEDELVGMLSSLDKLGVVGTRVINASQHNLLASLRDLQPVVRNLADAGDKLAPGLNLLVSFPFPKEASEIVQGDYANTSIRGDISLQNFLPSGGLPGISGLPDLPLSLVTKCLGSGLVSSAACVKVFGSLKLIPVLTQRCRAKARNPVCRTLHALDSSGGRGHGHGHHHGGLLGGLPDVPGLLGLSRMTTALTSGAPDNSGNPNAVYGGSP